MLAAWFKASSAACLKEEQRLLYHPHAARLCGCPGGRACKRPVPSQPCRYVWPPAGRHLKKQICNAPPAWPPQDCCSDTGCKRARHTPHPAAYRLLGHHTTAAPSMPANSKEAHCPQLPRSCNRAAPHTSGHAIRRQPLTACLAATCCCRNSSSSNRASASSWLRRPPCNAMRGSGQLA